MTVTIINLTGENESFYFRSFEFEPLPNLWIKPFELDAGIGGSELPIDTLLTGVTPGFPRLGLLAQGVQVGDTAVQALPGEDTEFQFGDIQPTPMRRGVA